MEKKREIRIFDKANVEYIFRFSKDEELSGIHLRKNKEDILALNVRSNMPAGQIPRTEFAEDKFVYQSEIDRFRVGIDDSNLSVLTGDSEDKWANPRIICCSDGQNEIRLFTNDDGTFRDLVASNSNVEMKEITISENKELLSDLDKELRSALSKKDVDAVKKALESGTDVNSLDCSYYDTPLSYALEESSPEVCEILINDENIDLNKRFSNGRYPPLMWAQRKGYFDLFDKMIEKGADVNVKLNTWYGGTLLGSFMAENFPVFTDRHPDVAICDGFEHIKKLMSYGLKLPDDYDETLLRIRKNLEEANKQLKEQGEEYKGVHIDDQTLLVFDSITEKIQKLAEQQALGYDFEIKEDDDISITVVNDKSKKGSLHSYLSSKQEVDADKTITIDSVLVKKQKLER